MSPGHHSPYPQVRLQGQEREPTATPDPQRAPGQPRLRWGPGGGREAEGKGGETGERRREGGRRRGKFGARGRGAGSASGAPQRPPEQAAGTGPLWPEASEQLFAYSLSPVQSGGQANVRLRGGCSGIFSPRLPT